MDYFNFVTCVPHCPSAFVLEEEYGQPQLKHYSPFVDV